MRMRYATRSYASTIHSPDPGCYRGGTVSGNLLPLLAEAAKRKQILRVAVERDFESLRPDISAGYTNAMLKRLIYTTAIL